MADFTCCTEIPTIVEIGDVDHVRFVRAFNTTWSAKSDRDGIPSYFRRQWRPRLYRPCRARVWSRVSSWVDFSSRHHHHPLPASSVRSRFALLVNSRDFPCVFSTHTRVRGVPSFNLHDGTWGVCGRATGNPPQRFRNLMQNDLGLFRSSEHFSSTIFRIFDPR